MVTLELSRRVVYFPLTAVPGARRAGRRPLQQLSGHRDGSTTKNHTHVLGQGPHRRPQSGRPDVLDMATIGGGVTLTEASVLNCAATLSNTATPRGRVPQPGEKSEAGEPWEPRSLGRLRRITLFQPHSVRQPRLNPTPTRSEIEHCERGDG